MGVAALVLGIISILIGIFTGGVFGWLGAILGVLGIILGSLARSSNASNTSIATAGLICSIIGTGLCLLLYIACVACISGL